MEPEIDSPIIPEIDSPIILIDVDMLSTGERIRGARLDHPDLVSWDLAAHRNRWPDKTSAESLWASYVAYACVTRLRLWGGAWDAFQRDARVGLHVIEDGSRVDPTQTAPEHDSVSS